MAHHRSLGESTLPSTSALPNRCPPRIRLESLRYSSAEFPGTIDSFRNRLHPEDADAIWAAIERHVQKRVPYKVEYRLRTKSGEYQWFLARGQAIWNTEGKAIRMSGSIQDITERKQAELNLKTALSEIKELKEKLDGGDVFHGKTYNYRKDGSEFIMEWKIVPIHGEEGVISHYLAIQREVQDKDLTDGSLDTKFPIF